MIFIAITVTVLIIFVIYFMFNIELNLKNHIHDNNDYPDMKYIFDNRNIIINEFYSNVLNSEGWSSWMEYDKVSSTPIFTKMTREEIIQRINENTCLIGKGTPSWKLFGLILYKQQLELNASKCPNTLKLLGKCPEIINACFSCLEPGVITALHHDFNHDILRCHIPIIIPEGNTAIKINNDIIKWHQNQWFIFDDTFDHQAWNFTDKIRIVLIIDIVKKKHNTIPT